MATHASERRARACVLTVLLFGIVALCIGRLPAQVVHLANHGDAPFAGWKRLNVDTMPSAPAGWRFAAKPVQQAGTEIGDAGTAVELEAEYVRGRQTGLDTWAVDVWCRLAPGQRRDLDLATFDDHERPLPALPPDLIGHFGGLPACNGIPMALVSHGPDGAAWDSHWRCRVGRMLVVDAWVWWYPGQPWALGEARVTCSNPTIPDLTEQLDADLSLSFGDAVVQVLGAPVPGRLVASGTSFGDGQSRAMPLTLCWLRHLTRGREAEQIDSFRVDQVRHIGAVGIKTLWPTGNPRLPASFAPIPWANSQLQRWFDDLHRWSSWTIAPNSGVTGEQTFDQLFVRGEAMLPGGAGAEIGAYLAGLKMANRTCHNLEADGAPLTPSLHTGRPLIFWHGRPSGQLWNIIDRLGKPRTLNWEVEASGWQGPDVEHPLMGSLMAGARFTGSPACQEELRTLARVYMLQQTTVPSWSNSQSFASRAIGYECMNAVLLWRNLEDRGVAEQVRAHWFGRWGYSLRPAVAATFWPDGFGEYGLVSLWQQCVGAGGLWMAGREFGVQEAVDAAMAGARNALLYGCSQDENGRWRTWSTNLRSTGAPDPALWVNGVLKPDSNTFYLFGFPIAAWLCRGEPRGGAIWAQMQADASEVKHFQWFVPEGN